MQARNDKPDEQRLGGVDLQEMRLGSRVESEEIKMAKKRKKKKK